MGKTVNLALVLIVLTVSFLAYSNGANDNFKGVATLYGSGTCGYHPALFWATGTTLAGSLLALLLAGDLMMVGASRLGLPVSTTHVSVGALFGIGAVNGTAWLKTAWTILLAWMVTLPTGAAFAGGLYLFFRALHV